MFICYTSFEVIDGNEWIRNRRILVKYSLIDYISSNHEGN